MRPIRFLIVFAPLITMLFGLPPKPILAQAAPAGAQRVVNNGDFEVPDAGDDFVTWQAGETFGGWTVRKRKCGSAGTSLAGCQRFASRLISPAIRKVRSIKTCVRQPGQSYHLRFAMAGNPEGPPRVKKMQVSWNSAPLATLSFDTTGHSNGDMGWVYLDFQVEATSMTTRLSFQSMTKGVFGPMLDDVSASLACTITGTPAGDLISGTSANDTICAVGGNDTVFGRAGDDTVFGGHGGDTLIGGGGADQLHGNSGSDVLRADDGEQGNDTVVGGPGQDTCVIDHGDNVHGCETVVVR